MSYSRWSHSDWYTYWSTESGDTKETQILCINGSYDWMLKYTDCIEIIKSKEIPENMDEELIGYINDFINDIDRQNGDFKI